MLLSAPLQTITLICLALGQIVLSFLRPTFLCRQRRHRKPSFILLAEQSQDGPIHGDFSGIAGLSRRELLSWGPLLTGVISAATINPDDSFAESTSESILKAQVPFSSTRKYKSITLNNELKVLLVSDRQAVRAATAFSIAGAGQFSDPNELPGCAHLMEHMILSSTSSSRFQKSVDFEDWLADVEGASNAFTGYEQVCFHFMSPPAVLMEALVRFSRLFNEPDVIKVCQNEEVLRREIRRVSSELDFQNGSMQAFSLVKETMNPNHPYSRFARGNIDTLERAPKDADINVPEMLFSFFRQHYQSPSASLVVVGPFELSSLERWVAPFGSTLSRERRSSRIARVFPTDALKADRRMRQVLLYRPKADAARENLETLSMHWTLDLNYNEQRKAWRNVITASQIGFVLSQIVGRRGPGSLYYILVRRLWVPDGRQGVPRISFPVDVSGFQLMKLDMCLTLEGFANRAVVVAYVYKLMNSVFSGESMTKFLVSRQILSQYAVIAQLHGCLLAPRPPDAIELAVDQVLKLDGQKASDPSEWSRFPSVNNRLELVALQRRVKDTLLHMSDPSNAIIITTATDKALIWAKQTGFVGDNVPASPPAKWSSEKMTGAKYHRDDILRFTGIVGEIFAAKLEEDEVLPPLTNSLIPPSIRPPRIAVMQQLFDVNEGRNENWKILAPGPYTLRLRTPRLAPEPSCRCTFVFQLLSPRPARANTRQAAYAELWKVSFERSVADLAELGVPAGLAYDMSFNKYGVRLSFLGISQNLPSYCRRLCRRLARHHRELLEGPEELSKSIKATALYDALRTAGLSASRKPEIEKVLKSTTAYEAATEAIAFFKSCTGGVGFSEGDLLATETSALFNDIQSIFREELGSFGKRKPERSTMIPSIDELSYSPEWKPRFASSCNVPGMQLLSDACGRVPR